MPWHETVERIRIIREVEAAAAADMSGRLPWCESWSASFGDRAGLLTALRDRWDRWDRRCVTGPTQRDEPRMRRTDAGVLRILESHDLVGPGDAAPPLEAA